MLYYVVYCSPPKRQKIYTGKHYVVNPYETYELCSHTWCFIIVRSLHVKLSESYILCSHTQCFVTVRSLHVKLLESYLFSCSRCFVTVRSLHVKLLESYLFSCTRCSVTVTRCSMHCEIFTCKIVWTSRHLYSVLRHSEVLTRLWISWALTSMTNEFES